MGRVWDACEYFLWLEHHNHNFTNPQINSCNPVFAPTHCVNGLHSKWIAAWCLTLSIKRQWVCTVIRRLRGSCSVNLFFDCSFYYPELCTSAVALSWAPPLTGCKILTADRSAGRWERVWKLGAVCPAELWLARLSGVDPFSPSSIPGHPDSALVTPGTPLPPLISSKREHKWKDVIFITLGCWLWRESEKPLDSAQETFIRSNLPWPSIGSMILVKPRASRNSLVPSKERTFSLKKTTGWMSFMKSVLSQKNERKMSMSLVSSTPGTPCCWV